MRHRHSLRLRLFVHGPVSAMARRSRQSSDEQAPNEALKFMWPKIRGSVLAPSRPSIPSPRHMCCSSTTICACLQLRNYFAEISAASTFVSFSCRPNLKCEDEVQYKACSPSPKPRAKALGRSFVIFGSACSVTGWLTYPSSGRAFGTPLK